MFNPSMAYSTKRRICCSVECSSLNPNFPSGKIPNSSVCWQILAAMNLFAILLIADKRQMGMWFCENVPFFPGIGGTMTSAIFHFHGKYFSVSIARFPGRELQYSVWYLMATRSFCFMYEVSDLLHRKSVTLDFLVSSYPLIFPFHGFFVVVLSDRKCV